MASNKTTVSVYADDDLLTALNSFKDSGNHKSLNVAIVAILREKLFGETSQGKVSGNLQSTLDIDSKIDDAIAAKLSEIKDEIKEEYSAGFRGISTNITDLLQQRDREIDGLKTAIAPLLARLEALEVVTSEATVSAKKAFDAVAESEGDSNPEITGNSIESDAQPIIKAIANIAASDNSTASIKLPVKEVVAIATVETLNCETAMNTNEAFAIAQERGYKGNSKSFRDRFDKQDMAKDFGLRRIPHDGGREKWLYFDTKS